MSGSETAGGLPMVELKITDELDFSAVPRLAMTLEDALELRPARLIIDLGRCTRMDAAVIELLLEVHRRALVAGTQVSLRSPSARVRRNLRLTRADLVLHVMPAAEAGAPAAQPGGPAAGAGGHGTGAGEPGADAAPATPSPDAPLMPYRHVVLCVAAALFAMLVPAAAPLWLPHVPHLAGGSVGQSGPANQRPGATPGNPAADRGRAGGSPSAAPGPGWSSYSGPLARLGNDRAGTAPAVEPSP